MSVVRVTEIKTVKVVQCPPKNPIQLRWINIYGGWDTWVFGKKQVYSVDVKDGDFFQRVVDYLEEANSNEEVISKEAYQILTLGYEGLETEDVEGIRTILISPHVELIQGTPDTDTFVRLVVAVRPGTFKLTETDQTKHSLEIQIVSPKIYTQAN